MQFCTKRRSDCLDAGETMLDLIRKLIGTKAPDAEDDGGFKNTFGKSYGTDHLLKMGWLSYFASTFPPGSKWVPKAGTWGYFRIEMHWYAGVMMMFETMGEVANSTNNPGVAARIIGRSVQRQALPSLLALFGASHAQSNVGCRSDLGRGFHRRAVQTWHTAIALAPRQGGSNGSEPLCSSNNIKDLAKNRRSVSNECPISRGHWT